MTTVERILPIIVILCVIAVQVPCQAASDPGEFSIRETLPLDLRQREELRELIATDDEARALFKEVEREARKYIEMEPEPLRVIHYEGLLNTDPRRIESVRRLSQMDAAAALLHGWQASGDNRFAAALKRMILAWATTFEPTGNDVNENKLYPLFVAYEALRPKFEAKERSSVDEWLRRMAEMHAQNVAQPRMLSNRFTKSLRMLAIFGRILHHEPWREASERGFKRFVSESLRADGTSFDLEHRDSLTYHNSALRPLIELAILAGTDGPALYTCAGSKKGEVINQRRIKVPEFERRSDVSQAAKGLGVPVKGIGSGGGGKDRRFGGAILVGRIKAGQHCDFDMRVQSVGGDQSGKSTVVGGTNLHRKIIPGQRSGLFGAGDAGASEIK